MANAEQVEILQQGVEQAVNELLFLKNMKKYECSKPNMMAKYQHYK